MSLVKRIQPSQVRSKLNIKVEFESTAQACEFEPKIRNELDALVERLKDKEKRLWILDTLSFLGGLFKSTLSAPFALDVISRIVRASDSFGQAHQSPAFDLSKYPLSFPSARAKKRHFVIVLGPTNSGKTHEAMQHLTQARSGAYLAPLRLLALEGQESLLEQKVPCDLITGEERVLVPFACHVSSTIEMTNFGAHYEVAVVDEVQLISDLSRGKAWVAAICGLDADTVYLLGSPDALPTLERLLNALGDTYEVRYKKRLSQLHCVPALGASQAYAGIKAGDALIAFNRADVLYWRDWCKRRGFTTAVVYGALSPEVRKQEAKRFSSGQAEILIATDAIGLGLNLPINRIVFTTTRKFDGTAHRFLHDAEIRQISGRAGRFGLKEAGEVTCLHHQDHARISYALSAPSSPNRADAPLFVHPTVVQIFNIAQALNTSRAFTSLFSFQAQKSDSGELFAPAQLRDSLLLCALFDTFDDLDLHTRLNLGFAPFARRHALHGAAIFLWASALSSGGSVPCPAEPAWLKGPTGEEYLLEAESLSLLCSTYLTLSYKVDAFNQGETAKALKSKLSNFIEKTLADASVLRHGPCDYSFLLSILDPETKNYLLDTEMQKNQATGQSEDYLTAALCRVSSAKQKALEDEFKQAATNDDWPHILKTAFVRALPCLPFYQHTKEREKLRFLGWFIDTGTLALTEKSILGWMGAMLKPYPKWRSRLSYANRERFYADLEKALRQLGFNPLKLNKDKPMFGDVMIGKLTFQNTVVLRFKSDFALRDLLPAQPTQQFYRLVGDSAKLPETPAPPSNNPDFQLDSSTRLTNSHLKALGLIR